MRVKKITSVLMAIILLMSIAGCSSPKKETPKQVKSESKGRIVATTVAVTEIMDALEVDLVGVPTSSKTLPKRYKGLPEVGNPMSPDMEKVKSLKPSEVLSVTTLEYELKPVFDGVGMKANFLDLTSLKNMQNSISDLGKKYGREKQAEEVVTKLDKKVASIQKEVKGKKEPTVLILLGVPGSYLVATEHSYIGDLVKQLGGKNIVQGEKVEYLASNTEYLKKADPDIILRAAHGMPDEVVKMFDKEFKTNDIWKHFAAVKNNRVYDLEERLFGTTGNLAAIEALDELKKMMYP
ncbi:heme ABC transporter substrate-binding protein IsdE [Bacillus tropicus]|uniref:heme ABC transporter substrate-binding protein IsdE n=1 Tax=Bacillus tropicus TaxID=2026188 RepID=UPI0008FE5D04|nr:heme ABC transporter substrate-binding protein IsdE [Bacillus tropicus]MDF9556422.1 heme ABC transporter substrate-binding protein IsdE [Bacillus tropicus]MDF9587509.1 heme ABC transporter substrate-binding protein IsdE [Bacillus tropicus]MDF9648554.1 heme ABC transporter substrate-binding protein IsdE [Bacillus tropicus]OJE37399.1 heme ABC transporter substrate-binding protein IsdE [Bacillus tropicus]HDR7797496.1 heme ABC transporter substrate-binding protein IsdE [Bacillus tropicus]